SAADPFTFEGGKYGFPQALDANGDQLTLGQLNSSGHWPGFAKWENAGSDRPELYACPFTGYLYLTAHYESGPYNGSDIPKSQWPDKRRQIMLLYSTDDAKTWHVLVEFENDQVPLVMTSTPNG